MKFLKEASRPWAEGPVSRLREGAEAVGHLRELDVQELGEVPREPDAGLHRPQLSRAWPCPEMQNQTQKKEQRECSNMLVSS